MLLPAKFPENGQLGVFAPSSPFSDDRFARGIDRLRAQGFRVTPHAQTSARLGFLAGDDQTRLAAFHELLRDPSIDALIAARGGYGAHRFVDQIDFDLVRRAQKPIIGFSDVCAIHSAVQAHAGLATLHGPVVTQYADLPEADVASLRRVLNGDLAGYTLQADRPAITPGRATGVVVGGCISVLTPLVGSPHLFVPEGAILILEDVTEAPYRIDRLLTHLRLAGVLGRVAGVGLGDFVGCDPLRPGEQTVEEVLADRLGDLGVPVLAGLPFGHGKRNQTLPLGAIATLDADRGCLVYGA